MWMSKQTESLVAHGARTSLSARARSANKFHERNSLDGKTDSLHGDNVLLNSPGRRRAASASNRFVTPEPAGKHYFGAQRGPDCGDERGSQRDQRASTTRDPAPGAKFYPIAARDRAHAH